MELTREQVNTILQNAPVGADKKKILDGLVMRGYKLEGVDSNQVIQTLQPKKETMGQDLAGDFRGIGEDIISSSQKRAENIAGIREGFQSGEKGLGQATFQTVGQLAGAGADAIGSAFIGGAKMLLKPKTEERVKEIATNLGAKVIERPEVQKLVKWYDGLDENTQDTIDAVGGIASLAAEFVGVGLAKRGGQVATKVAKEGLETVGDVAKAGVKKIDDVTSPITNRVKQGLSNLNPTDYDTAVKSINDAYKTAFVGDKVAVNKKLTALSKRIGKTPDEIVENLAKEGIVPQVEGKLAKFDNVLTEIDGKIDDIVSRIDDSLAKYDTTTPIEQIKLETINHIKQYGSSTELNKSLAQIEKMFGSIQTKYGDNLTPLQINQLRKEMNRITKAYKGEVFIEDVASAIGDSTRKRLDEIVPEEAVRKANAEAKRLIELQTAIKIFDNQAIDVGFLGTKTGQLAGALLAGSVALPTGATGGLVIAGLFATYGGNAIAQFLRTKKFSAKAVKLIKEQLKNQPDVLNDLMKSATKENAKYLERFALPAPKSGSPRVKLESGKTIELPKESASTFESKQVKEIQEKLKSIPSPNSTTKSLKGKGETPKN